MTSASQQTEVRHIFHDCRLGRSELDRIFNLAPEGISTASVTVSTQRDSTRYSAGTIADLIDSVQNANAPGNLHVWNNLMQEAEDPAGDRKVVVSIDSERVEVQVSGKDATWVHGQAARLELLLIGAGGHKSRPPSKMKEVITPAVVMMTTFAFMFAGGYIADPNHYMDHSFNSSLSDIVGTSAGAGLWFASLAAGAKILSRVNRSILLLTSEVPQGSWWHRATNADRIALCGLGVSVVALVLTAVALGNGLS